MIFPKYIKKGDTIGVTATSSGITNQLKIKRFANATEQLKIRGYNVVTTDNVFTSDVRGCSSSGMERAHQLNQLLDNEQVSCIISAAGGDYLMEMLGYVDFEKIKTNPKWFQGFSDNTGMVYPIVTTCDVAAVYGCHFGDFGMKSWQRSVKNALGVLEGTVTIQKSFDYFESERHEYETGYEGYCKDEPVKWVNGRDEEKIEITGRMIGGCFDVISFLIGTKYDGTEQFINKYADDGIIWVLESFNMEDVVLITHLWQMKERGYFKNAAGFVFGRPLMYNTWIEQPYKEAVMSILGDLDVPVIFDADIGHKGPQFSIVMGAMAKVTSEGGKGTLEYQRN
ncbi:MAG: S66 peptidase family protein [Eubacterium sp.]